MRVITGIAKGKKLETLEGMDVRPTTDRVKEGMFSAIQFDLENSLVLDLFAGSGQLGIEALSRGACSAVFVDNSKKSLDIVKNNLTKTDFMDKSLLFNMNSMDFLKITDKKFDIIFLDPPYNKGILLEILPMLTNKLNFNGKIICEHEKNLVLPEKIENLRLKKTYKYGKINVSMYLFDGEDE
ncbi:16S rRNA (guanine(966)-N(2))-methyltransferase RsmD [Porcipelethomonas sp.]|uniref:16S rRNA (guanine(966)-N(2))-methyltransferase RsmD n=1 Tax=Porcipelethomonas sp. TaxID=2981675 RepID=UPI003EF4BE15